MKKKIVWMQCQDNISHTCVVSIIIQQYYYIKKCNTHDVILNIYYFGLLGRFGKGVLSITTDCLFCPLLQFPLTGSRATEPCTRSDDVPYRKLLTVGLSLYLPLIRCLPKKLSSGSWHNFSLSTKLTSSERSRYLVSSTKDFTAIQTTRK